MRRTPRKKKRDIGEISALTVIPSPHGEHTHAIMKLKNLRKKIRRLEKRLQEGPKKLAKLRDKLKAAEAAKALKAKGKSAVPVAKPSASTEKKSGTTTKAKRKLNLSPERRAQLSAAMKARWAAKRAAEASIGTVSADDQHSAPESPPKPPEGRPDGG